MKLLVVTHYFPQKGGIEAVALELIKRLINNSHIDIKWMASDVHYYKEYLENIDYIPMKTLNIIEDIFHLPSSPIWGIGSLYKLWRTVNWCDIVHLHDTLYMGNIMAFTFAKLMKKPIIVTQHIGFIPYDNWFLRELLSFLNKTVVSFILRRAEQVVFISGTVQKYFLKMINFKPESIVIPNGVDHRSYFCVDEETRLEIRTKLELPKNCLIFLFVGRFVERKGLPIIYQLAQKFKSVHWICIGSKGSIDPTSWGLPNLSVFVDLKKSELVSYYQVADLLVLPSKGEGFPLVLQEAFACGIPVMVGQEVAKAYPPATHLIFAETVEDVNVAKKWSEKINNLIKNQRQLLDLRPKLANFAKQHWDWEQCAEKYYKIFDQFK